jgi:hypothetical protein
MGIILGIIVFGVLIPSSAVVCELGIVIASCGDRVYISVVITLGIIVFGMGITLGIIVFGVGIILGIIVGTGTTSSSAVAPGQVTHMFWESEQKSTPIDQVEGELVQVLSA